jgi:hypothetical protein
VDGNTETSAHAVRGVYDTEASAHNEPFFPQFALQSIHDYPEPGNPGLAVPHYAVSPSPTLIPPPPLLPSPLKPIPSFKPHIPKSIQYQIHYMK